MTHDECDEVYRKWEKNLYARILIDGLWEEIFDIKEDAHLGWVCRTKETTIQLIDIDRCHIDI